VAKPSADYHDYVFRDGKLIGDFEGMYRHSTGTPWHQDEQENWIDVRLTCQMLQDLGLFDEVHDLGCGLRDYLASMRKQLGTETCTCFGYDISASLSQSAAEIPQLSL